MAFLNMGVWGMVGAEILSQCIYNIWIWPSKVSKELNLTMKDVLLIGWKEFRDLWKSFILTRRG